MPEIATHTDKPVRSLVLGFCNSCTDRYDDAFHWLKPTAPLTQYQGTGPSLEPTKNQLPATVTQPEITSSDYHDAGRAGADRRFRR